jgi:hypothetical protein
VRDSASVWATSARNVSASRAVIPTPQNTTAKGSPPVTRASRTIRAARSSAGRPEPLKMGSFWPRTRVFSPSIALIPVSIGSAGGRRLTGFIGAPHTGTERAGMGSGSPSSGRPSPSSTRPSRSAPTEASVTRPVRVTAARAGARPRVSSKT